MTTIWYLVLILSLVFCTAYGVVVGLAVYYLNFFKHYIPEDWIFILISGSLALLIWNASIILLSLQISFSRHQKSLLSILMFQVIASFAFEVLLIYRAQNSMTNLINFVSNDLIERIMQKYSSQEESRVIMDYVHQRFKCCGLTTDHYEWVSIGTKMGILDESKQEFMAWVPDSCCINVKTNCSLVAKNLMKRFTFQTDREIYESYVERSFRPIDLEQRWYSMLKNTACPTKIRLLMGEYPTYSLAAIIILIYAKNGAGILAGISTLRK